VIHDDRQRSSAGRKLRLAVTELKLFVREPIVLTFETR
jgi:hypothetical protein